MKIVTSVYSCNLFAGVCCMVLKAARCPRLLKVQALYSRIFSGLTKGSDVKVERR